MYDVTFLLFQRSALYSADFDSFDGCFADSHCAGILAGWAGCEAHLDAPSEQTTCELPSHHNVAVPMATEETPVQAVLQARLPDSSGVERRWLAEVRVDICRGRNAHPTASTIGTGVAEGEQ